MKANVENIHVQSNKKVNWGNNKGLYLSIMLKPLTDQHENEEIKTCAAIKGALRLY